MSIKQEECSLRADGSNKETTLKKERHLPNVSVAIRQKFFSGGCRSNDEYDYNKEIEEGEQVQALDFSAKKPKMSTKTDTTKQIQQPEVGTDGNGLKYEIHECSQCKLIFPSSQLLKSHMKTCCDGTLKMLMEDRSSIFKCKECSKNFTSLEELNFHVKTHLRKTPLKFDPSIKDLGSEINLNLHKKKGKRHLSYREYYPSSFDESGNLIMFLKAHKQKNQGVRTNKCDECGKTFHSKSSLDMHVKSLHTEEAMVECDVCGAKSKNKYALDTHYRIHTGERPFLCEECGKTFTRGDVLAKHKRVHTGERPFKCSECGKAFGAKVHLNVHMRIHTGKPFECTECGKLFATTGNLRMHTKVHYKGAQVKLDRDKVKKDDDVI